MKATLQSVHANRHQHMDHERGDDWRDRAACNEPGVHTDAFFADKSDTADINYALSICGGCDVRDECKAFGKDERYGIWGGVTEWERKPPMVTSPWPTKIPHGTNGGYDAHKLRGQEPCEPCRLAGNEYRAALKRRRAERAVAS